jgi:hypothetical protein
MQQYLMRNFRRTWELTFQVVLWFARSFPMAQQIGLRINIFRRLKMIKKIAKGSTDYYNAKVKEFSTQQANVAESAQKKIDAAQQIVALLVKPTLTSAEVATLLTFHDLVG